jgi:glycosyltransferase involved in cell wall biosynthesis
MVDFVIMKVSVIIPAYNEINTIAEIVRRVQATGIPDEIVIVDDDSTDGTRDVLKQMDGNGMVRVILRERNQGKGAAEMDGIRAASGEVLLIQDADLEYDPRDFPELLRPIEEGIADVVYGSRWARLAGPPCSGIW